MRIEAGKITLRSVDIGDVATILQWENDPTLAQYSDPHLPYTEQDIVEFIVEQQRGFEANGQLRLMICLDNHPIGAIDLFNHKGTTAEVGVLIYDNRLRRQGYATQALEQVKGSLRSWASLPCYLRWMSRTQQAIDSLSVADLLKLIKIDIDI